MCLQYSKLKWHVCVCHNSVIKTFLENPCIRGFATNITSPYQYYDHRQLPSTGMPLVDSCGFREQLAVPVPQRIYSVPPNTDTFYV
jgi:hypothetical protein